MCLHSLWEHQIGHQTHVIRGICAAGQALFVATRQLLGTGHVQDLGHGDAFGDEDVVAGGHVVSRGPAGPGGIAGKDALQAVLLRHALIGATEATGGEVAVDIASASHGSSLASLRAAHEALVPLGRAAVPWKPADSVKIPSKQTKNTLGAQRETPLLFGH